MRRQQDRRLLSGNLIIAVGALVMLTPLLLSWLGSGGGGGPSPAEAAGGDNPVIMAPPAEPAQEPDSQSGGDADKPVVDEPGAGDGSGPSGGPDSGDAPADSGGSPGGGQPASAPVRQAGYRLVIPEAGVDEPVLEGIDDAPLKAGPGHYPATPQPGEEGNAAIAGHRTYGGERSFFYDLNRLEPGDPIRVVYPDRVLHYQVERVFITTPYDVSVLDSTPEPALTLTTCDPPGSDLNRLIVRATLTRVESTTGEGN